MLVTIVWNGGEAAEAVVLKLAEGSMRVMSAGFSDTVELRLSGEVWRDEQGQSVAFDFIGALSGDVARFCAERFPLAETAAS